MKTEEQQKKHDEKIRQFKTMQTKLKGLSVAERLALVERVGAVVTIEGKALSVRNTILCYYQHENVSVVGGFRQWIRAGRCVSKGQRGISILVPMGKGKTSEDHEDGENGERVFFSCGTVFDISQTEELRPEPVPA